MKTFRVICAAALLALSLSIPVYADTNPGDGHGPGKTTKASGIVTTSDDSASTGATSTAIDDGGLVTIADILWALASIY